MTQLKNGTYNDPTESSLGIRRHRISLIKNDDFERWVGVLLHLLLELGLLGALPEVGRTARLGWVADGQGGEVLDFVTDYRNAALIGGVELQYPALQLRGVPQRSAKGKRNGGLAGAGRTIKQEVGEAVRLDGILEGRHDLGLMGDVGEILGTILLYPRRCRNGIGGFLDRYHDCCLHEICGEVGEMVSQDVAVCGEFREIPRRPSQKPRPNRKISPCSHTPLPAPPLSLIYRYQ